MAISLLTKQEVKGTAFDDATRPEARTKINALITQSNANAAILAESDWLDSVSCAADANVNIASAPASIDGVSPGAGVSAVLTGQTDAKQNLIYDYTAAGVAMTPRSDFDEDAEVTSGATVRVTGGTRFQGVAFYVSTADPIVVGTTNITWGRASEYKFNVTTSAPGTANDGTQGYSPGSWWLDTSTGAFYVAVSVATGAAVWVRSGLGTYAATAPTATDDDSKGYFPGALWHDTSTAILHRCHDNSTGAAKWNPVNSIYLKAGLPAVTDDLANGFNFDGILIDSGTGRRYRCANNATGAAVWIAETVRAGSAPTVSDDDTKLFVVGSKWIVTSAPVTEYVCLSTTTGAALWVPSSGARVAAGAPAVTDDDSKGHRVGGLWYNTVTATLYLCHSNSTGAAVWKDIGGTTVSASLPTASDDLTKGYRVGSEWYTTSGARFVCTSAAAAAAVWDLKAFQVVAGGTTLAGDVIGATTETKHESLLLPAGILGATQRTLRWSAATLALNDNAADTWRVRVRLGTDDVSGVLVCDTTAFDLTTNDLNHLRGEITIYTTGAGGTFQSVAWYETETGPASGTSFVTGGAINTTVDRYLVLTGESSSANANQQMESVHHRAEVLPA